MCPKEGNIYQKKIKIVKEYLSGQSSLKEIGARYGYTSHQGYSRCYWRWIALYREHGEAAFFRKGNSTYIVYLLPV